MGCFTFGGGYAMVPLIQREIIDNRKWISADEFLDLLALAQSSPGPIAINTSVFVGYKMRGILGSIVCIVGTILASFVIILLIAMFFSDFTKYPLVESAFKGMRPVVVALIAAPVYGMAKGMGWIKITLAAAVAVIVGFLGVSPVYFLIAGVVGGIIWGLSNKGRVKE
ncbi:MAG: chromate transporter [Rikenellaceae bacterium]|nr:chromate transporter [Rikenellaceae bacterium]